MKTIKFKLISSVTLIIFLALVFSNILSNYILSDTYEEEVKLKHKNLGNSIITNVQSFLEKAYRVSEQLAYTPSIYNFNAEQQTELSISAKKRNPYFDLVFIQDTTGMQTARSSGNLGDRSERWWFKKIKAELKPFISKSYYSLSGNIPVTSVFIPIYDADKTFKGILGTDIRLNILQDTVEKFSSESAYVFIIDGQGTLVAHPEKERVAQLYNYKQLNKTVLVRNAAGDVKLDNNGIQVTETINFDISPEFAEIVNDVLSGKSGFRQYQNLEQEAVFSYYNTIKLAGVSDDWAIITIEKVSDAHILKDQTLFINLLLSLISILIIVFFLVVIVSQLVGRLNFLATSIRDLSEGKGDLTKRLTDSGEDEISNLSRLFNTFLDRLQSIISEVKTNTNIVTSSSLELAESSSETTSKIQQQNTQITNVADATFKIKCSSDDITNSLDEGITNIESTNQSVIDGNVQLDKVISELAVIARDIKDLKQTIDHLSDSSNAIGDIITVIDDIASQTNLLALNAAIEAARAGDQGRGFSVVADEVRLLAEKTQSSTQKINDIVTTLQSSAKKASKDMESTFELFENEVSNVNDTRAYFQNIVKSIDQLSSVIYSIKSTIEIQDTGISSINEITQQISSSSDQSTSSLNHMSKTSQNLGKQAENLKNIVDQFKTD